MAALPSNVTRYTGANCFSAGDAVGNVFYVFQDTHDVGVVVMVPPTGASRTVLTMPADSGRPSLDCNPTVGLWAVGNRETGSHATPPRYPIKEYVPFAIGGRAPVAIPPNGAIAALFQGVYVPSDFDTPAEVALRSQKQLDAIQEIVELLKAARVLV